MPGKKYLCIHPACGHLEVQDQPSYWSHVRERHWNIEDLIIACPHCREKFPLNEMLKFHIKLSHPKTVSTVSKEWTIRKLKRQSNF